MSSMPGSSVTAAGIALAAAIGIVVGIGGYTFVYAKGSSYLTNDPVSCTNCHVMNEQFDGWTRSSHRSVATCNDCHAPHTLLGKYLVKAENGFRHSLAFTTGRFHEPIQITTRDRRVAEANCRYCHEAIVDAIDPPHAGGPEMSCTRCHGAVGHPR